MLDPALRQLAWRIIAQDLQSSSRRLDDAVQAVLERMNARGMLNSGMTVRALIDLYAAELKIRAMDAWRAIKRVLSSAHVPIDEAIADDIKAELNDYIVDERKRLFEQLKQQGKMGMRAGEDTDLRGAAQDALAAATIEVDLALLEARGVKSAKAASLPVPVTIETEYDVFISHAWEDKDEVARPLAQRLQQSLHVWYDEFTLTVGDSLREKIDLGLARSRFGVVILSPSFFKKKWPQAELNGLFAKEVAGNKVILPVWHAMTFESMREASPILADRYAANTDAGLDQVVNELLRAIRA